MNNEKTQENTKSDEKTIVPYVKNQGVSGFFKPSTSHQTSEQEKAELIILLVLSTAVLASFSIGDCSTPTRNHDFFPSFIVPIFMRMQTSNMAIELSRGNLGLRRRDASYALIAALAGMSYSAESMNYMIAALTMPYETVAMSAMSVGSANARPEERSINHLPNFSFLPTDLVNLPFEETTSADNTAKKFGT